MYDIFLKNITLSYQQHCLFNDLSIHFSGNQWSSILGPSGTGKTSLLRLIADLPTGGRLSRQSSISTADGPLALDNIAYLSQQSSLLPWLNTFDNVLLGYRLRGKISTDQKQQALHLLEQVGLKNALHKRPAALSGGMQQRAALVRTLLENKPIILLDEPFSALDVITRMKLQTLAASLLRDKTVILVTHDPLEALRLSHHIFVLAGHPAKIVKQIELSDPAPRDVHHANILKQQADLLTELQAASIE